MIWYYFTIITIGCEQPEDCPIQGDNNKRESKKMESLVSLSPGGNESPGDNPIIFNLFHYWGEGSQYSPEYFVWKRHYSVYMYYAGREGADYYTITQSLIITFSYSLT